MGKFGALLPDEPIGQPPGNAVGIGEGAGMGKIKGIPPASAMKLAWYAPAVLNSFRLSGSCLAHRSGLAQGLQLS